MEQNNFKDIKKEEVNTKESINISKNIKSKLILKKVFNNLPTSNLLKIIKYNKKLKNKFNIKNTHYYEFSQIEIELKPIKYEYGTFINILDKKNEPYIQIYFNDGVVNKKRYHIKKKDKVSKIRIIIDYQIKSFYKLFSNINIIESIEFKKYNRSDITNMSHMFSGCKKLKKIILNNFKTNEVVDMSYMFYYYSYFGNFIFLFNVKSLFVNNTVIKIYLN